MLIRTPRRWCLITGNTAAAFVANACVATTLIVLDSEERFEMAAAFGPDAEVVDILTGKAVQL